MNYLPWIIVAILLVIMLWNILWDKIAKNEQPNIVTPSVKEYAEMYAKVELIIEYLDIEVKSVKPHFEKKTKKPV